MKISSRLDYALCCALCIAENYGKKELTSIKEICEKEGIEFDYVEKLLIAMKKAGILKSVRGRKGGYALTMPPGSIRVKSIVEAIEKEALKIICFRKKARKKKCLHSEKCEIKDFWVKLKSTIESFLEQHTLKDLLVLRNKEKLRS